MKKLSQGDRNARVGKLCLPPFLRVTPQRGPGVEVGGHEVGEVRVGDGLVERDTDVAVAEVAHATQHLLDALTTSAAPKNREVEAEKARARAAVRYAR